MTQPPASREELLALVEKYLVTGGYDHYVQVDREARALLAREVPPRCGACRFQNVHDEAESTCQYSCDLPKGHSGKHRVEWGET